MFCGGSLKPTCWDSDEKNWGLQVYHFKLISTEREYVEKVKNTMDIIFLLFILVL